MFTEVGEKGCRRRDLNVTKSEGGLRFWVHVLAGPRLDGHLIEAGAEVPPHATLVFDVLLVDIHNPKDNITVEEQAVPESCNRRTVAGDYIRYHYNGTFLNGVTFDTRSARRLFNGAEANGESRKHLLSNVLVWE